ncbi:MAG TPA: oligosaccharide flippase family protein [Bacteroidia bacterium]|nr:oligosaccharide flippase family protein [Bacteroidia bacterium]
MSPFKKLASQTAIYGLPTIVGRLLNYLLVPIYTRTFSTAQYGTVNEMYAYVSFLLIVLTYGMETSLFNFSRNNENKEKVYSTILLTIILTSSVFILGTWLFAQPIADLINYPNHTEYIIYFGWILGLDAISSIAFAKLREQQKAGLFAGIKILNIAANIFFNLFFIVYCPKLLAQNPQSWLLKFYDPQVGVGYVFVSNLISSIITILIQFPFILRVKFTFDFSQLKTILKYSSPLLLAGLAGMTNETIDRILLKYLLPENIALEQVGIYGACYKISLIMTIFIQTFRFAAEPFFFSHSDKQDAKQVYARVMKYFVIICSIIFLGTMINLSWIQGFIGKDFRSGLQVVPLLLMANFFLGVFFNLSIWYKLTNQTRYGAWLTIFGAVITLAGNFIFIPRFGYMACAYTTLVCYLLMMLVSYFIGNKHYHVNYDVKRIVAYIGLSLLLFAISQYINFDSDVLGITIKNLLLILFALVVFLFERKEFRFQ